VDKNLTVIGGDLRIVKLIEMLVLDGYKVYTYALENAENLVIDENVIECTSLGEAIEKSEIVIGPIPLSSNRKDINTPFSSETISLVDLFNALNNKKIIAGGIRDYVTEDFNAKNIEVIDLLEREELTVLNTISTAEGAIQIAMEETISTIHGAKVLVLGFGRIGKILSKMLYGIGARVSCEARKESDIAWIKAYGYNPVHLNILKDEISKYDIIINTVPHMILNEEMLDKVDKNALLIDLASNPGGIDRDMAKRKGLKTIWALSLPGKVAPLTSAEFIKDTLYNILKEMKGM
jgi:dipicolinate synthase subunit A